MATRRDAPWLLQDAPRLLTAILDAGGMEPGRTHVAYVGGQPQELRGVFTLKTPSPYGQDPLKSAGEDDAWVDDEVADEFSHHADADTRAMLALADRLCGIAEELAPPRTFEPGRGWSQIRGGLFTVVCRTGRVVSTAEETQFHSGWRYSNHGAAAIAGDVLVVTPHGWTSTLTEACGMEPALPRSA